MTKDYTANIPDDQIILELGQQEVAKRIIELPSWKKYNTHASYEGGGNDVAMTTNQMKAWTALAATISDSALVMGGTIVTMKPAQELVAAVVANERDRRADLQRLREQWDAGESLTSWDLRRLRDADPDVDGVETEKDAISQPI